MNPAPAIDILVTFSRLVSVEIAPGAVMERLAETAHQHELVDAVVVVEISNSGRPVVVAARGGISGGLLSADGVGSELEQELLRRRPSTQDVYTLPLVSGGGLYGAVVMMWDGPRADETGMRLIEGLVDMTAVALDRAHQTASLQEALTELERSQEALARREKLEALGQMAAVVAHEVKNPLASVSGALQVLASRLSGSASDLRVIDLILERVTGLAEMVDELLVFARPRPPILTRIEVARLLEGAAELFRADPAYGGIHLTVRVQPADATLLADLSMLQPVLSNLLLNAAQAVDGRGEIRLLAGGTDDGLEIRVHDSGPGVPADQTERIFEPFVTTKTRGSGLGLAIARQAVEAHAGTIALDQQPGQGACFVMRFPQASGR